MDTPQPLFYAVITLFMQQVKAVNIQDYVKTLPYGQPEIVTFNREHPKDLTCDVSPSTTRQYSWYVESDEVQSLLDWATEEQFGQVKNTSENHNTIQLLPSNVSTVQKKMIYCMDDTDAIKNMFELRYSGNEILYPRSHMRAPCSITEGFVTALSCEGATRQTTGHCTWYYNGSRVRETKETTGPVLVLGDHVDVNEGFYKCRCQIYRTKTTLREFRVTRGEPNDSYFCKHIPKSDLTSTTTAADITETTTEETTTESSKPERVYTEVAGSETKNSPISILQREISVMPPSSSSSSSSRSSSSSSSSSSSTTPANTKHTTTSSPGQHRSTPDTKSRIITDAKPPQTRSRSQESEVHDETVDNPYASLHSQEPEAEAAVPNLSTTLIIVIVCLSVILVVLFVVMGTRIKLLQRTRKNHEQSEQYEMNTIERQPSSSQDGHLLNKPVPTGSVLSENGPLTGHHYV